MPNAVKLIAQSSFSEQQTRRLARSQAVASRDSREREPEMRVSASPMPHDARAELLSAIEEQVIPRLLIAHNLPPAAPAAPRLQPMAAEIRQLTTLATQQDLAGSLAISLGMLGAGMTLESLLLQLVAAAARQLGAEWVEDRRSFSDVTVGLGTLHELVHVLSRSACDASPEPEPGERTALLVREPGEQHTLGLYVFAELLRHSRWTVVTSIAPSPSEVLHSVRARAFDVVGISVSSSQRLTDTGDLIQAIRRTGNKGRTKVLIGGPVDLSAESKRVGARYCPEAREAIDWLDRHVEPRPRIKKGRPRRDRAPRSR